MTRITPSRGASLLACTALAGCASIPGDPSRMSADQLTALAKDRSASAACTVVNTPWGPGRTIYISLDKATIAGGTVTIGPDCTATITAEQRIPLPPRAASAP